jgi:hypothetical protein
MEISVLRVTVADLAQRELALPGPLPPGDLAEQLDSVQRLQLVVAIEDHFRICFDPEDDAGIRTLDDAVALIASKLGEEGPGGG